MLQNGWFDEFLTTSGIEVSDNEEIIFITITSHGFPNDGNVVYYLNVVTSV